MKSNYLAEIARVILISILVIFGRLSAAAQSQPGDLLIFKMEAPVLLPEDAGISFHNAKRIVTIIQ